MGGTPISSWNLTGRKAAKMKLSLYEQETIILYNQAEDAAEVYTDDPRPTEKLSRLSQKYPDQV